MKGPWVAVMFHLPTGQDWLTLKKRTFFIALMTVRLILMAACFY